MIEELKTFKQDPNTTLFLPPRLISTANLIAGANLTAPELYKATGDNYNQITKEFTNRNTEAKPFIENQVSRFLLEGLGQDSKVLDIGCGAGLYSDFMASKGVNVTGVDISEAQIQNAKANSENTNINYINTNFLDWESSNNQFDGVLVNSMMQYILKSDNLNFLTKVRDMMKDEAKAFLIVKTNNESSEKFVIKRSHDKISSKIISRYTELEYLMLFQRAGFSVLNKEEHPHEAHPDEPFLHVVLKKKPAQE